MTQTDIILEVKDLCVEFRTAEGTVQAVDHLSYVLHKGEKLGIVGESGSGKSVSSLGMMQLIPNPPGQITGGEILYLGRDLVKTSERDMQKIRGNEISMIFQEPMTSLNPIIKCGKQIAESLRLHRGMKKKEAMEEAIVLSDYHAKKEHYEQVCEMDGKFHKLLYEASGSRMLSHTLSDFHQYVQRVRQVSIMNRMRLNKSGNEHTEILEAIKNKDADLAEQVAARHIFNTVENLKHYDLEEILREEYGKENNNNGKN